MDVYLDHAGAARPTKSQLNAVFSDLTELNCGNPHSRNPSSRLTTELINQARYRVLSYFNTTQDSYSVVFCSGATAALKLVSENFDFGPINSQKWPKSDSFVLKEHSLPQSPAFLYLLDNHTSVTGMRELVNEKAHIYCVTESQVDDILKWMSDERSLFVFPAQSNFCGRKYPLDWIEAFQKCLATTQSKFVCLDAASFASTNFLDLSKYTPDFVVVSFYKIFGFPTGLGALLIRNKSAHVLNKSYFGGGTVLVSLPRENFHRNKTEIWERFEEGTIDYLGILALKHGFDTIEKYGGIKSVSQRVFALAQYTVRGMQSLKHGNGAFVVKLYCEENCFLNPELQGSIVGFNLLGPDQSYVQFTEVEKMAELYNISLRTGCFCNQGACQIYLNLTDQQVKGNFQHGKVCGDTVSLIDGKPVGCVRISFGFTSTLNDSLSFLAMLYDCFVVDSKMTFDQIISTLTVPENIKEKPQFSQEKITDGKNEVQIELQEEVQYELLKKGFRLTDILIYPIKSCSPISKTTWNLSETGLAYDRKWMICSKQGACLTQKRCHKLCEIRPEVDLKAEMLILNAASQTNSVQIPLEIDDFEMEGGNFCENDVCADRISTYDCGKDVSDWLSLVLSIEGCSLRRQTQHLSRSTKGDFENESKVSLANVAQYLLINRASIRQLLPLVQAELPNLTENDLVLRFRPNLVLDGAEPFEEESWKTIKIGQTIFKVVGLCQRCQMICIDQNSGVKSPQILKSLRDFRQGKMTFGVYLQTEHSNWAINVFDGVEIVEKL